MNLSICASLYYLYGFNENKYMASALKQRVKTAIIIGIPILFLVFFNDFTRLIFLSLIALLASYEYLSINYSNLTKSVSAISSFVLGAALLFVLYKYNHIYPTVLGISLAANLGLIYDLFYRERSLLQDLPSIFNILYVILPLALLIQLYSNQNFGAILISSLLLIWVSDISAYFVGKSTGRRKLFPKVSPGKTWEGFLGAGLTTIIFSYFFFSYFKIYSIQTWALIGLAVWLFGSIGDLVESKFKRKVGIKDSGTILPGHGGFLDRFDGFIFCIPFVSTIIYFLERV